MSLLDGLVLAFLFTLKGNGMYLSEMGLLPSRALEILAANGTDDVAGALQFVQNEVVVVVEVQVAAAAVLVISVHHLVLSQFPLGDEGLRAVLEGAFDAICEGHGAGSVPYA